MGIKEDKMEVAVEEKFDYLLGTVSVWTAVTRNLSSSGIAGLL